MNDDEKFFMLQAMRHYGGGFVSALSEAWARADATNAARLAASFPDITKDYGPGSAFYEAIKARSA